MMDEKKRARECASGAPKRSTVPQIFINGQLYWPVSDELAALEQAGQARTRMLAQAGLKERPTMAHDVFTRLV